MRILREDNFLNCWYEEDKNEITFFTKLDRKEYAIYNKKKNELLFNSEYKNQFPTLRKKLLSKYKGANISEFINVKGLPF